MKNKLIICIVACLPFISLNAQEKETPPKGAAPKNFSLPAKEVVEYDNGLTLVLVPYGSIPKATISVVTKTGRINEGEDKVWLSTLVAELLKQGSTNKTSVQISDEIAGMGGNLNVGSGMHNSEVNASVLYEFTPAAIALIADVLKNPKWPETELARLKNDMKRNLSVSLSSPQAQASRDFFGHMYKDHAYGRLFPSEEQIDTYTMEDVKNFYDTNFGAKRTTIYVAGKFNKDEVKKAVDQYFADWREGTEASYDVAIPNPESSFMIIDRPGAPQSTIYYGLPTIDPSNEDFVAMEVTNSLLGGSFGSRITSNIREDKGYTYSPSSALDARFKSGLWYEVADVTTEFTGASIKEINNEIVRLQNEAPSQEEIEGIVNYESGLFVLRNATPAGIINQMVFLDMHDLDESYLKNKVSNMHKITPGKVQEMAKKYIRPEDMTLIVVGDKSKIQSQITQEIKQ